MEPSRSHSLISLGLPVFNGENYLEQAIQSILAQTYPHFELVISDNASTDATRSICEQYARKDARIRYYRYEENRGASWNFNNTFYLAQGDYFKWAAHDDVLLPRFLEETLKALQENPSAVVAYPVSEIIDSEGHVVNQYNEPPLGLDSERPSIRFEGMVFEVHLLLQVFGLIRCEVLRNTSLIANFAASDIVLLGQLALAGPYCRTPSVLFQSRDHIQQSWKTMGENLDAYQAWFDPSRKGKTFPYWRLTCEHTKSVLRADISTLEKLACLKMILTKRPRIKGRKQYLVEILNALKHPFARKL